MREELRSRIEAILGDSGKDRDTRLSEVCHLLRDKIPHYDWVGFYFHASDKPELHLGPYAGASTNHTVIPFGKGICGQVAESEENFVVPDVAVQDNYIACSVDVRSEIVVPLFKDGKNIGQIDIDSHQPHAFSSEDERFLEFVNARVAAIL